MYAIFRKFKYEGNVNVKNFDRRLDTSSHEPPNQYLTIKRVLNVSSNTTFLFYIFPKDNRSQCAGRVVSAEQD